MKNEIRTRTVVGERPAEAPAGWTIFNAPRPMYGAVEWRGEFESGVFYTAHDPDAEDYAKIHELNRQQDAIVLTYISEEEAFQKGRQGILDRQRERGFDRVGVDVTEILDEPANRSWVVARHILEVNGQDNYW